MKRPYPIHPLLFAAFPVLFLYAQNANDMLLDDLVKPLLLIVSAAATLTVLISLILWNLRKGGIIASAVAVLFLSYGHIVNAVPEFKLELEESVLGPNLTVLVVLLFILYLIASFTIRSHRDFGRLTSCLNWLGLALVIIQVAQGSVIMISRQGKDSTQQAAIDLTGPANYRPDIYYIILDGYGRSDILRQIYNYDNSVFLSKLRERGFDIADSSFANYPQTVLSLTSSLNMQYVEELGQFDTTSMNRPALAEALRDNAVFHFLHDQGYKIVAFASGYSYTEMNSADTRITPAWSASEFDCILLTTTPLPLFSGGKQSPFALHRHRVSYIFDKLPRLTATEEPKFVFAHIVCPHPPFVFDADGEAVMPKGKYKFFADGSHRISDSTELDSYINSYRAQIAYISDRALKAITDIIDASAENTPVIILQADHGPGSALNWDSGDMTYLRERFAILNAYLLPGDEPSPVYNQISPVNSFRLILNRYFHAGLTILPDRHVFAPFPRPFAFTPVTEKLNDSVYTHWLQYELSGEGDSTSSEK